jgi:fucose permease
MSRKHQRLIIFAFFFFSGIYAASWSSRIPDMQKELDLSNAQLGNILFAMPAGLVFGLSFASWLIEGYGFRKIMLLSCIGTGLMLFFIGSGNAAWQLALALFLFGIGRTVFNLAANTGALEVQKLYDRPINSTFHGVWSIACLIAMGIGKIMITNKVPTFYHFLLIASVMILLSILIIGKKQHIISSKEKRPFFVKPDRYLLLLGLIAFCAMMCEGAMFDWSVLYFTKVVKAEISMTTYGFMSFIIFMATGRLIGDRFISRFGVFNVLMFNGACLSIGLLIVSQFPNIVLSMMGFGLIGIGSSILVPIVYLLSGKSKTLPPAYALSSVTIIGYTGFLSGPLLIGNVSDLFGMPAAFLMLSILSMLIIFLAWQVKKIA